MKLYVRVNYMIRNEFYFYFVVCACGCKLSTFMFTTVVKYKYQELGRRHVAGIRVLKKR